MASKADLLEDALRRMAEQMSLSQGEHPSAEQLLSCVYGKTTAEENEHIQDHLSLCPDCCQLVLESQSFLIPAPEQDDLANSAEMLAVWEELRERLLCLSVRPEEIPVRPPWPSVSRGPRRTAVFPWVAAAAASILALGLSLYTMALQRELSVLRTPTAQVVIQDLLPGGGVVRGAEPPIAILAPRGTERVLFILHLLDDQTYPTYRLVLQDEAMKSVWQASGLQSNEDRSFAVVLPYEYLPAGRFEFKLHGQRGSREELLATYPAQIE